MISATSVLDAGSSESHFTLQWPRPYSRNEEDTSLKLKSIIATHVSTPPSIQLSMSVTDTRLAIEKSLKDFYRMDKTFSSLNTTLAHFNSKMKSKFIEYEKVILRKRLLC